MTDAVEQRDDRGALAYRRRERLDRFVEVVGLAAQQHDVKLVLDGVGLDDRRILQRYVAVRAFDHEARGGKLRGAARPHQKGDVAAGLQHPAAEVSANGPGANDENAHLSIPLVVGWVTICWIGNDPANFFGNEFSKQIPSHFHCICSAQQALSIRQVGSIKPSNKTSLAISCSVRRRLMPPVFLVPGWVDLKGNEHDVLLPQLVAFSRLTGTLAEPNTLAGNGLRPPGLTCWIQLSVSRLASAETGPMMAVSSLACARR